MSNHLTRFHAAVSVLVSHGDIKQRLIEAFEQHLAPIDDEQMPISSRQDFADLRHAMSQVEPLNGEGAIRATVRKMSVIEADRCAGMVLDIFASIVQKSEDENQSMPLDIEDQAVVPPFLVKTAG